MNLEELISSGKINNKEEIHKIQLLDKSILALSRFSCDLISMKYDENYKEDPNELKTTNAELKKLFPTVFNEETECVTLETVVELILKEYEKVEALVCSLTPLPSC